MKKLLALMLAAIMVLSMAACGGSGSAPAATEAPKADASAGEAPAAPAENAEIVDGKFTETRHITVEVYDRGNDGGTDPTDNMYTDYIKAGMLEDHNVEVEFVKVPRWTEGEELNNLLAGQTAPDICVTYSYPTIQTYAEMGGVLDLSEMVEQYRDMLPNLWDWLGEENIYWDKDPKTGTLWAIEARRNDVKRIATFVRQDWLDALGLAAPTTTEEFEAMLYAFRDRAAELPVDDAKKVVPFSTSYDIGWRCSPIIESFVLPVTSDKDFYVNGFDDRMVTQIGTKEAVRLINKWYNDGLLWKDFALYGSGDTQEDDNLKAGYVGAFCHNWDYPFRNAENSINASLTRQVGPDAKFVAVDCFTDSTGKTSKYLYGSSDRKLFFPVTNTEPLASLLYLDWISDPAHIEYLQIGDEGVTHEKLEGGAVKTLSAAAPAIMNSGNNIDLTITCNGLKLVDAEATAKSQAYGYAECDPDDVSGAIKAAMTNGVSPKNVNVGAIEAEAGVGDTLSAKRDTVYDKAAVSKVEDFDATWDANLADYLSSGAQDIMDERAEKWAEFFGDATMLP